jgi:hypothetical protein
MYGRFRIEGFIGHNLLLFGGNYTFAVYKKNQTRSKRRSSGNMGLDFRKTGKLGFLLIKGI